MLEIVRSGGLTTVQDIGRHGYGHLGITRSGALDPQALKIGNVLLNNPCHVAALEIALMPFRARFSRSVTIAVTGADARIMVGERRQLPWSRFNIEAGEELEIAAVPEQGQVAYVCVPGGIQVGEVMGAASTDLRAGFGGYQGRALLAGDTLGFSRDCKYVKPCGLRSPNERGPRVVRFLPAMEWECLTKEQQQRLSDTQWRVSRQSNRIGYRFEGQPVMFDQPIELLSYGILPGLVQLPPSGEPIVQLSDAQTVGGYPRLGLVLEQDRRVVAQTQAGQGVWFKPITLQEALTAKAEEQQWLDHVERWLQLMYGSSE